ncbi:uncharacterized protein A1O9_01807 [Exophiala aquamarina CBS 119918]|uniref:Uncharacterized protein n=1 Tax=Exophiala aquamarina CBS 119918 TaxID=1182545 RepID=A0A072PUT8_9EURO|nr:uncharacterized protein A1O9_01807 [Exophiala aquamarina CBS 119918]KEF63829.1 hypothetical protein A1O9_01807 [Exophiala aquamarina CBS 119918]
MCGDSHLPPAPESGDLIAIIHPNPQSTFRGRLRLSNRLPGATASSLQCETVESSDICDGSSSQELLSVRIHKYGQPVLCSSDLNADSDSEDERVCSNPILHSFVIDPASTCSTGGTRLNLGVGVDGVVGRTVSILDRRRGRILGQGVIGWD